MVKKLKCPCGYIFRSMSNCIAMQFYSYRIGTDEKQMWTVLTTIR